MLHRYVIIALIATLATACSAANVVNDAATITVGSGQISPIDIDRSITVGLDRIPACIEGSVMLPDSGAQLSVANSPNGCALTLTEPNLVLLDRAEAEQAQNQSGPIHFDADGIKSGKIMLQSLEVTGADGQPMDLSRTFESVSLTIDGQPMLTRIDPGALQGDSQLSRELPDPILQEVRSAIRNDEQATAQVSLTLVLSDSALSQPPDELDIHAVVQPEFRINVLDAAL